jgi:hypothetical protein
VMDCYPYCLQFFFENSSGLVKFVSRISNSAAPQVCCGLELSDSPYRGHHVLLALWFGAELEYSLS